MVIDIYNTFVENYSKLISFPVGEDATEPDIKLLAQKIDDYYNQLEKYVFELKLEYEEKTYNLTLEKDIYYI